MYPVEIEQERLWTSKSLFVEFYADLVCTLSEVSCIGHLLVSTGNTFVIFKLCRRTAIQTRFSRAVLSSPQTQRCHFFVTQIRILT